MKSAICDLAQLSNPGLFEEISTGIKHVIDNVESLDEITRRLIVAEEYRGADIMRRLAEEESAKILILVDAVRCPRKCMSRTLRWFDDHVAKGIYANACWWRPQDFREVASYVERDRRGLFLDGPNDFDWIFPNSIKSEREQAMYVDYVQDITVENGEHMWLSPVSGQVSATTYSTPESVEVSHAIFEIGATTPKGLAIVAKVWRDFEPQPQTTKTELCARVNYMLQLLIDKGLFSAPNLQKAQSILYSWPFPLWPLDLTRTPEPRELRRLRCERTEQIKRRAETEMKREPAPVITRGTVERLSELYSRWNEERETLIDSHPSNTRKNGLRIIHEFLDDEVYALESYRRLQRAFQNLTLDERMDLAALAWFGRSGPANWPYYHKHARATIGAVCRYDIELGAEWRRGLDRWERAPEWPDTSPS